MQSLESRTPRPGGNRSRRENDNAKSGRPTNQSYHDRPADTLLARLAAVRETGPGKWSARCPAHEDRTPSLSVRETADGTLLLKCWAGCGAADIVQAVGLELRDLFPPRDPAAAPHRRRDPRAWTPLDALRALSREGHIVMLAAEQLHRGETLSDDDRGRLALAVGRLADAMQQVGRMTR